MRVKIDKKVPPGNYVAQVEDVSSDGKEMKLKVGFLEPTRDYYCSAKGCTEEFEALLTSPMGPEYKFCPYHWGVIVHNLIEVQWAPLEEVLQVERQ